MKLHPVFLIISLAAFFLAPTTLFANDWPQWRGPNRDGSWNEPDVSPKALPQQLQPVWSVPVGPGYSGPTVSEDRVVVTDRGEGVERVRCFARKDGKALWVHEYPCEYTVSYPLGPRAAVSIHKGKAYALGAMGHIHCLDAETGKVVWAKDPADYQVDLPVWGIAGAPLVDPDNGNVVFQLGGQPDACLVAFDLETGKESWRALGGKASYSAPRFIEHGGKRIILAWTGDWIAGIDPADGTVAWQEAFSKRAKMVINVPDPVLDARGERFFLSSFYDGSYAYRLKPDGSGIEKLWSRRGINERKSDALHSMIMTSLIRGEHVYGIDSYGEFRCLDLKTGERVWLDETLLPKERWATAYFAQNDDVTWMVTESGKLVTGRLSPSGFEKISEAELIEPTTDLRGGNRVINWSHPAFAGREIFARNDRELTCTRIGK